MATAKDFGVALGETELAEEFRALWEEQRVILEEQGFNGDGWRHAAHIVWWSLPPGLRKPKSEVKLAPMLGVTYRTLYKWREDRPDLYPSGVELARKMVTGYLPEVMYAAYRNAKSEGPQGAQDRRLLAEIGGLRPSTGVDVTSGGVPIKAYSVLANPDMWDEKPDPATAVDSTPVADSTVAG